MARVTPPPASEFREALISGGTFQTVLTLLLGAALGGVFFYVGIIKHFRPYVFAESILAYRLLPASLVGLAAATIPWLELTPGFLLALGYLLEGLGRLALVLGWARGAALLGGIKRRSCLLLLILLSAGFLIILGITLARGLKIDCGCGLFIQREVGPAAILEDVFFLALAVGLYWRDLGVGGGG